MSAGAGDPAAEARVLDAIVAFVRRSVPPGTGDEVGPDTVLLGSGLLDSLAILQMVVYVTDEFGVEIGDEDFTEEHFATPAALARFVATRGAGADG